MARFNRDGSLNLTGHNDTVILGRLREDVAAKREAMNAALESGTPAQLRQAEKAWERATHALDTCGIL